MLSFLAHFLFLNSFASAVVISSDTDVASAGYYQLRWRSAGQAEEFLVEEVGSPDFYDAEVLYRGFDMATAVTGRGDGTYYYRVSVIDDQGVRGDWSPTIKVEVKHHSLPRTLGFFAVGALAAISHQPPTASGDSASFFGTLHASPTSVCFNTLSPGETHKAPKKSHSRRSRYGVGEKSRLVFIAVAATVAYGNWAFQAQSKE